MLFHRKPKNHGAQLRARLSASDQVAAPRKPGGMPAQSLIDASLTITGDLRSDGDVQVDGHICGNICCAQLIVGRDACITGAIMAEEAVVRGRITGTIRAMRVILQGTAHVESEITYDMLAIDEGARFEGAARCRPNPYEDAVSSMAELQQMMVEAKAGMMNGGADGNKGQATSKGGEGAVSSLDPEAGNPTGGKPAPSA